MAREGGRDVLYQRAAGEIVDWTWKPVAGETAIQEVTE